MFVRFYKHLILKDRVNIKIFAQNILTIFKSLILQSSQESYQARDSHQNKSVVIKQLSF